MIPAPKWWRRRARWLAPLAYMSILARPAWAAQTLQAFQESAGSVAMEAEHYDAKTPLGGHDWTPQVAIVGHSGGSLQAMPNSGASVNSGYVGKVAELVYNVQFSTTGTYYVWLRGYGPSNADDTVHTGIDSSGPASCDRLIFLPLGAWVWSRNTMDNVPATLTVQTPGFHTFHIWMREDGFIVDKVLLTTSSSATAPTGFGPPESPRITLGSDTTVPTITGLTVGPTARPYIGDTVTFTTTVTDPDPSPAEYRYLLDSAEVRPWSTSATFAWTAGSSPVGARTLQVQVRDDATQVPAIRNLTVVVLRKPVMPPP